MKPTCLHVLLPFVMVATATPCFARNPAADADPALTVTEEFLDYLKQAYNPHGLGVRDGRFYPYQTPFGGRRIGYRQVIRDKSLYRVGWSPQEAADQFRADLHQRHRELEAFLKQKFPGRTLAKLSETSRQILLDLAYTDGVEHLREDVCRAVMDENWDRFINGMLYVRARNGSPDSTLNRAFADRWIYSNKLQQAKSNRR